MTPGPEDPAASGDAAPRPSPESGAAPPGEAPGGEPYGPLLVERLRKDDGRALILFSRRRAE